ncbi:MAG: HAD family hydrolase [Lachnospiraceae bacterium]|jgi:putative hydrolase of the HAD superfamily|nr:HAD family hydrolase [Lachnospiraceae bacterium]
MKSTTEKSKEIQAVLFDVDDTLYDQAQPFAKACEALFGRVYSFSIDALFASSRRHSDEVFELSRSGAISMEEMYIYRIQRAFADFQIPISDAQALEFQRLYAQNQDHLQMSDKVREILGMCRERGVVTGVITNGPSSHQWKKVETLGLTAWVPTAAVFVSDDVGAAKPDRKIFDHAAKVLGLEPQRICFVGDSFENDVRGAKMAGWQSVWLNRRKNLVLNADLKPDYCAESEEELLEIVDMLTSHTAFSAFNRMAEE